LIRVIANDGMNTSSATSTPFTVRPQAPIVHIDTPNDGALFVTDSQIVLMGGASDPGDAVISDEGLQWLVNDEAAGSGRKSLLPDYGGRL
jgi:hypothetical protein